MTLVVLAVGILVVFDAFFIAMGQVPWTRLFATSCALFAIALAVLAAALVARDRIPDEPVA